MKWYLSLLFVLLFPVMMSRINVNPRSVIWSDSEGYYSYLPGLFIVGDFHKMTAGTMAPVLNDKGEFVNKYTCGVAIFEAPFFFAARAWTRIKGEDEADYFNRHYCRAIAIAGFFWGFCGLFVLRRALLRWYSERTVFWTLMAVFFGTNLFHYITREMSQSHAFSFFLFACLLWHVPRFFEKPSLRNAALLGGILGWAVLVRPTNALAALFLLLYEVYDWAALKNRALFFLKNPALLGTAAAVAFLFFVPQMLYWHEMTGHWIYYSYQGEGFPYWNKPKIAEVLFDPQNGLFLYSPMALVFVGAMFWSLRQRRDSAPALLLLFALMTYVFASWWAWWFGGAFGHRCYIEYYPLLVLPMASCLQALFDSGRKWPRLGLLTLLVLLMAFSVRLSFLYTRLPRPWDGEDWRWNWEKYRWVLSYLFDFQ